jgi:hypothetical protein
VDPETALGVAKALSALFVVVLIVAVVDVWRRNDVPTVTYGGITLATSRLRWLWVGALVGGVAAAADTDPLVLETRTFGHPDPAVVAERATQTTGIDVPVMFYRYQRTAVSRAGTLLHEEVREGVMLPWQFLSVLLAYVLLVVRWNPTNRWAMRILHGRRGARRLRRGDEGSSPA